MALTTLPTRTVGSLGESPKSNQRAIRNRAKSLAAEEYEVNANALVGVCAEVGLHDGSTPGSLVERAGLLERLYVGAGQTWATYTTTGALASHAYWKIEPAAAVTMTLPALPSGSEVHVRHMTIGASAYAVTLARNGGTGTINGASASLTITARSETTLYSVVSTSSGHVIVCAMPASTETGLDYIPEQRASTSSLYLFDGNLNDSGPAGRNLTAVVGTMRYVPVTTGTRQAGQPVVGTLSMAQAAGAWTDPVDPVTIEGVVETLSARTLHTSGGVIACLMNAASPSGSVWALRVMSDYTVSLYFYDASNTLRELFSTLRVPNLGIHVIHGVISVSGGDTTLSVYIDGILGGTSTFVGQVPRSVANQRVSTLGWLNGSATYSNVDPRPVYAVHLMTEALDASTCLARARRILNGQ